MWTEAQDAELQQLMRGAGKPYVRKKATAVWNYGRGQSQGEIARFLNVGRRSVNRWVNDYRREGATSFDLKPGRGRPSHVDEAEVTRYVKQSPRNFGLEQTRWTLRALAETVPSLEGFTVSGVRYLLNRLGFSYKRGQPTLHSPDPDYDEKRAYRRNASRSPGKFAQAGTALPG